MIAEALRLLRTYHLSYARTHPIATAFAGAVTRA
jgi:hypothetical protein